MQVLAPNDVHIGLCKIFGGSMKIEDFSSEVQFRLLVFLASGFSSFVFANFGPVLQALVPQRPPL